MPKKKAQALVTQLAAHDIFGQFRFIKKDDGEILFVAVDVCKFLRIKNHRDAVGRLDDDEKDYVGITDAIGRVRETLVVNESGLYSLIFMSRKPAAKNFRKWVTSEVLPSIRKTGKYELPKKKAVKEISYEEFFTALFEIYPDAEPEITGISFSEDENGNVFTHYHVDYMLPDGNFVDPEKVAKKILTM